MPGPPPNPNARRRNVGPGFVKLPSSGRKAPPPELPATLPGTRRKWRAETLEWWEAVWRSPMAVEFLESDYHGLLRLAVLRDRDTRGMLLAKEHAEIRQLEDRFGLSPLARLKNRWVVVSDGEAGQGDEEATDGGERSDGATVIRLPVAAADGG